MGSQLKLFSLYKISSLDKEVLYVLIRTEQPAYSNANYGEELRSTDIEARKRNQLLNFYVEQNAPGAQIEFIGEQQVLPFGDKLYAKNGNFELPIYYQQTEYGFPWILLGSAATISDFKNELKEEEELMSLKPIGAIHYVQARLITEFDFDLPEII